MPSRKNHYQAESWSSPSCSSSSSSSDDSSDSSDLSDDWSSPDPDSPFCSDQKGRTPPREHRKQEKKKTKTKTKRAERGRSSSKAKYKEPCLKDIEKKNRKKSPARTRSRRSRRSMAAIKKHKRRSSKGTAASSPPKTPPPVPSTPSRNVPVANGPGPSPFSPPEMLLPGTLSYQPYYQPPQRFTYATPGPPGFQHHQPAYYTTSPFQSPFSAGPGVPHTPAPPAFGSAFTPCAMPPSAPVHTLSLSQQLFHTQAVLNSKMEELSHNPGNMGLQTQVVALRGYVNNIMDQTVSQHTVGPVASPLTGGGTSKPIEASAVSTPEMSPEPEKPEPPARHTCTNCGSLRSRSYHRKHPMKEGKPSFPSLCISCREEMQGRDVAREGDLQLCFGCGICRSRNFRSKNPIIPGQPVVRNYCSRCGDERLADERRAAEEAAENTETSSDASPPPPAPAMRHPVEQAPEPPSSPRTHSPSKHSSPVKSKAATTPSPPLPVDQSSTPYRPPFVEDASSSSQSDSRRKSSADSGNRGPSTSAFAPDPEASFTSTSSRTVKFDDTPPEAFSHPPCSAFADEGFPRTHTRRSPPRSIFSTFVEDDDTSPPFANDSVPPFVDDGFPGGYSARQAQDRQRRASRGAFSSFSTWASPAASEGEQDFGGPSMPGKNPYYRPAAQPTFSFHIDPRRRHEEKRKTADDCDGGVPIPTIEEPESAMSSPIRRTRLIDYPVIPGQPNSAI